MEEKNEFDKVLETGLTDEALLSKLEQELKLEKDNVITDPNKVKELDKRIKALKSKLAKENEKKPEKVDEDIKGKSISEIEKAKEAKEKKIKEEKNQEENNIEENSAEEKEPGEEQDKQGDASTVKAYEDAMQKMHDYRLQVYSKQIRDKSIICSDKEFEKDVELEKQKIALKASLTEEEKENIKQKEETLAVEERKAKEPILADIRERSRKYAELMVEQHKVNQEIAYIHDCFQKNNISSEDYEKRSKIALDEQVKIKAQIETLNPKELTEALAEEKNRRQAKGRMLGFDFERAAYKEASSEEKANIRYANDKQLKQEANLEFAEKEKVQNPKARIEERQDHMQKLKKELDELPDNDIERRFEILKELETENLLLEKDQQKLDRIDKNEEPSAIEEVKDDAEIQKKVEEVKKENEEAYKETKEAVAVIDEQQGRRAVESPEDIAEMKAARNNEVVATGVAAAVILGDENDTIGENIGQAAVGMVVADAFMPRNEFENQLYGKTVNIENPEEAKAYIAKQEAIDELAKNQKAVEKQIEGNV